MKKRDARRPCTHVLSIPPRVVNGAFAPLPSSTIGNAARVCAKSAGAKRLIYQEKAGLKNSPPRFVKRCACSLTPASKRLRGDSVEQWIDRENPRRRLQPGVRLEAKPDEIVAIYVVIDPPGLHLLTIVARMRNTLPVGAAVAIRRSAAGCAPVAIEGASQHRERRARCVPIQTKQLLIKGDELGRGLMKRNR